MQYLEIERYVLPDFSLDHIVFFSGRVNFRGRAQGEEGKQVIDKLTNLARENALRYKAVSIDDEARSGLCQLVDLRIKKTKETPVTYAFSGSLVDIG